MSWLDFEYEPVLDELDGWRLVSVVAFNAAQIGAVYRHLADREEVIAYDSVVASMWRLSVDASLVEEMRNRVARLWPDDESEMDSLTPYHWKVSVLRLLKVAVDKLADEGERAAAKWAVSAMIDIAGELEGDIYYSEVELVVPEFQDEETPFEAFAWKSAQDSLRVLSSSTVREETVEALRELASENSRFIQERMIPLWVRANGWSLEDIDSGRGAEQRGR